MPRPTCPKTKKTAKPKKGPQATIPWMENPRSGLLCRVAQRAGELANLKIGELRRICPGAAATRLRRAFTRSETVMGIMLREFEADFR
jgi:hypothetical protein